MGEVFENLAMFAEQRPKLFFAVVRVARPKDMMVGAGDVSDGVDLHKAQITDDLQGIGLARLRLGYAVGVKPKATGLLV